MRTAKRRAKRARQKQNRLFRTIETALEEGDDDYLESVKLTSSQGLYWDERNDRGAIANDADVQLMMLRFEWEKTTGQVRQ